MKTKKLVRMLRKGEIVRATDLEWCDPNRIEDGQCVIEGGITADNYVGKKITAKGKVDQSQSNYIFRKVAPNA